MKLPIDIIPSNTNTSTPKFKWNRYISTPTGAHTIVCEGAIPTQIESAVLALINMTKQLMIENAELRNINSGFADRIVAQSEVISKKAETQTQSKQVKK